MINHNDVHADAHGYDPHCRSVGNCQMPFLPSQRLTDPSRSPHQQAVADRSQRLLNDVQTYAL